MIDKFQKLFGPNPPRKGAVHTSSPMEDMDLGAEDEEHRKQIARLKNKRRLIGLLAIVAAVAVVAPALFEPNDMYSQRGAKLEIPSLQDNTAAKVVPINRKEKQVPAIPTDLATAEPAAAQSLKSDNPVTAGAKQITTPEQKSVEAKAVAKSEGQAKSVEKSQKNKEEQKKEVVATKTTQGPLQAVSRTVLYSGCGYKSETVGRKGGCGSAKIRLAFLYGNCSSSRQRLVACTCRTLCFAGRCETRS